MGRKPSDALEGFINSFFESFSPTLDLAEGLLRKSTHAQEILILLLARLDALACSRVPEESSRQKAFVSFIADYGGHRALLESVSVPDLYYEFGYHGWLAEGLLPHPGRVYRFSRVNDPFIRLLEASNIPFTATHAERFFKNLGKSLRKKFAVLPGRSKNRRPSLARAAEVVATLQRSMKEPTPDAIKALKILASTKTLGQILYEKYRCGVIHGGWVRILDKKRFFHESAPYWARLHSEYYGSFAMVEFPARFLYQLLQGCIGGYRHHLIAKGKVPVDIIWAAEPDDIFGHLSLLDETTLPDGGPVKLRLMES